VDQFGGVPLLAQFFVVEQVPLKLNGKQLIVRIRHSNSNRTFMGPRLPTSRLPDARLLRVDRETAGRFLRVSSA
jgi:hypothetical protein